MDQRKPLDYPPLSRELSGSWVDLLRIFGPGAIIASVTVGTGETIFAPRAGAVFGYALMWVVAMTVLFKAVQVYTGTRYLVLTGEHPMEAWARIPGPRAWAPALIGLVAVFSFPLWIAALADAVGNLCVWVTGVGAAPGGYGRRLWGTGIIVAAMMLSTIQTYNIVERVSTVFLIVKVVLILAAVLIIKPDWAAVISGLILPQVPDYEPWVAASYPEVARSSQWLEIAVLMGAIGGGVQDYVGYVGFLRAKKWGLSGADEGHPARLSTEPESVKRGFRWLRAPLLDVGFSFGSVLVMTVCFMILGAAVLYPRNLVPTNADLYSQQSQFLGLVHPWLVNVYKAGIFVAIFAVIYGAFELYVHTAYEPLRAIWKRNPWTLERLRVPVILYSGLGGIALLWTGLQTVTLASIIAPLSGVFGCGLWCFAMIWVDRTQLPKAYRMNTTLLALTLLAAIVLSLIGGYVTVRTWFG